jgi:hypothetical protein
MTKEELEQAKRANAQNLGWRRGQRKAWTVEVDKTSLAVPGELSFTDRVKEAELEAKRMDREDRRKQDPTGLGIWGADESIDEVVRRQNQR